MKRVPYGKPLPSLGKGLCLVRETEITYVGEPVSAPRIRSSRDVADFARKIIPDGPRERLVVLFLDTKNQLTGWYGFTGGLAAVAVTPSDCFRAVVLANASSIVMVHNHPSGDTTPSVDDVALTKRMQKAGKLLEVPLLDHVIIGGDSYFSFLDAGMLNQGSES